MYAKYSIARDEHWHTKRNCFAWSGEHNFEVNYSEGKFYLKPAFKIVVDFVRSLIANI